MEKSPNGVGGSPFAKFDYVIKHSTHYYPRPDNSGIY